MLKRFKVDDQPDNGVVNVDANGKGKQRARVDDEGDDDVQGPDDMDDEMGAEDDEDGRFFGGGLNNEQQVSYRSLAFSRLSA